MTEDRPNKVKNPDGETMKAGGIIVRKKDSSVFVVLLYRPKLVDWTFPKGHIETGETASEASIREIQEEAGLNVADGIELLDETYTNRNNPDGVIVKMFLYKTDQMELHSDEDECEPHWIPVEEVEEKLSYQNLKDFFRSVKHLI